MSEALAVRDVSPVFGTKGLEEINKAVEHICVFLDPRRKSCSAAHSVKGSTRVKADAKPELNAFADTFLEAKGGGGGSLSHCASFFGGGFQEPTKKKVELSEFELRRQDRLAKAQGFRGEAEAREVVPERRMFFQRKPLFSLAKDN